jgi:hypothetical protein
MYTMADYKTNAHNMYLTGSFQVSPKVRLFGNLNYNMSDASYDEVIMPDVEERLVNLAGTAELHHQDFTFENMDDYSNLKYQILSLHSGIEYRVSPKVKVTVDGDFISLNDDAGYVYGIETGQFLMIRAGVGYGF